MLLQTCLLKYTAKMKKTNKIDFQKWNDNFHVLGLMFMEFIGVYFFRQGITDDFLVIVYSVNFIYQKKYILV